ncbi:MAG: SHOCT domain-containing protein, partial [Anaerolineales bacterium]|nr:SHOCT domain-containing protein [Anaerolineales bacterium]
SLEKVNDVVLKQSAVGRLLGFGDIEILTASEIGVNRLIRIHRPIRFKTEMLNQKENLGEIDAFQTRAKRLLASEPPTAGDIPELIAELDELRQKGILSQAEFDKKKQDLLNRL